MLDIEYEATFPNIDKDNFRKLLRSLGAELVRPEFTQIRKVFRFPDRDHNSFIRVRDEGDKITLAIKKFEGEGIESQREMQVIVDDFDTAVLIVKELGAIEKAFQETKRELWMLDGVEVTIDTWPFLEPFVEVEGKGEQEVRKVSEKLGFNWQDAIFDSVAAQYTEKYNVTGEYVSNSMPKIVFDMENPFV